MKKGSTLDLPPEIASKVARGARWSGPPSDAKDRMRSGLSWAFTDSRANKVVYLPGRRELREVPALSTHSATSSQRWVTAVARAAAALVLAHVPLALASLGVVVAAVPVTRVLLSRAAERAAGPDRSSRHSPRPVDPGPFPGKPVAPSLEPPPLPAHLPAAPIVPSLAPLPAAFPPQQELAPSLPPPAASAMPLPPLELRSPSVAPSAARVPDRELSLTTERELLERARRALIRDDPTGALAELDQHRAHYPDSQLSEEREALTIQALLRSGRVGDAHFQNAEFRRRFPRSLLLPALDAAFHD